MSGDFHISLYWLRYRRSSRFQGFTLVRMDVELLAERNHNYHLIYSRIEGFLQNGNMVRRMILENDIQIS